ncbi:hypothetical protein [Spirosoma foliorum]|uniref:Uncharacterized protein n=1 Tax=Spirosoma foliorum TaxID=2710596 RepID=A0A7G5H5K0_9BACT|nr:hypothetical protein [Spirosoma foliorum]QMW06392.1 hypothetical protein H3H32_16615 [Spirosoma foliorum]
MHYYIEQFREKDNLITGRVEVKDKAASAYTTATNITARSHPGYRVRLVESYNSQPCFQPIQKPNETNKI